MKKLLIYWPLGVFEDIQIHKEIGAIAFSATKLGVKTSIVSGKFNSSLKTVSSHETGFVKRNWITKLLDPFFALKFIVKESPDYMLFYNIENYGNVFLTLALGFLRRIDKTTYYNPKVIIKADTDGRFIETSNILQLNIYKLLLIAYSKLTSGIIIETTCGINKISNFVHEKCNLIHLPNGYSSDIFGRVSNVPRKQTITCVANIIPSKNIEAVLRIFHRLAERFKELHLKIVGEVQDNDYFEKIKGTILQMNLSEQAEILSLNGQQLAKLFSESLLTISTSLIESFGIARMESLGSGTPVVTYDVGCGSDFRDFGAIVVSVGDEEKMYNEIIKLLTDQQYWNQKSMEARKSAVTWDSVVQKLISIFQTNEEGD